MRKKKTEKGFTLVLALVLLLVMSLMGGSLIVISAQDHSSNNESDIYQQTFYVAETGLMEGEKFIINKYLGDWNDSGTIRSTEEAGAPLNAVVPEQSLCFKSFPDIIRTKTDDEDYEYQVVVHQKDQNFGELIEKQEYSLNKLLFTQFRKKNNDLRKWGIPFHIIIKNGNIENIGIVKGEFMIKEIEDFLTNKLMT